jgi:hypothetical protein
VAIIPVAEVAKTRTVDEPSSYSSDAGKAGRWQFDYQEDQYSRLVNILFFDNASALAILKQRTFGYLDIGLGDRGLAMTVLRLLRKGVLR